MTPVFAEITLPDGSVAAIVTMVTTLWTALVLLWRNDLKRWQEVTQQQRERIRELEALVLRRGVNHPRTRRDDEPEHDQEHDQEE